MMSTQPPTSAAVASRRHRLAGVDRRPACGTYSAKLAAFSRLAASDSRSSLSLSASHCGERRMTSPTPSSQIRAQPPPRVSAACFITCQERFCLRTATSYSRLRNCGSSAVRRGVEPHPGTGVRVAQDRVPVDRIAQRRPVEQRRDDVEQPRGRSGQVEVDHPDQLAVPEDEVVGGQVVVLDDVSPVERIGYAVEVHGRRECRAGRQFEVRWRGVVQPPLEAGDGLAVTTDGSAAHGCSGQPAVSPSTKVRMSLPLSAIPRCRGDSVIPADSR
jgi:hypothetical protein